MAHERTLPAIRIAPSRLPAVCLLVVCLLVAGLCSGCGDDEKAPAAKPADPAWSPPASPEAEGSPDGATARTAEVLLRELLAQVEAGRGPATPTYARAVESVAAVLWDPAAQGDARAAAQVHMQITTIVGDVAQSLAKSPEARAAEERREPLAVRIHDAWVEAAAGGPTRYAVWCANEGAALLRGRAAALQKQFFPPKK